MSYRNVSRTRRMLRRPTVTVILLTTLLVLPGGCNAIGSLWPERPLKSVLLGLPEPSGVVLLGEHTSGFSGSDERCYGVRVDRVFGSDLPFDDVVAFYEESLPTNEWRSSDESLSIPSWISAGGHFALVVSPNAYAGDIAAETILAERDGFRTLYYMSLSYMPNPRCRGG